MSQEFVTAQELPALLSVLVEDTRLAGRVGELIQRVSELEARQRVIIREMSERGWLE